MTLLVTESNLTQRISINTPNLTENYLMIITSQYSKQQEAVLGLTIIETNDRYTTFSGTFPTGFGDAHKSGIYNYRIIAPLNQIVVEGLVKIITQPGGEMGTTNYNADAATERRDADVYYRPNY